MKTTQELKVDLARLIKHRADAYALSFLELQTCDRDEPVVCTRALSSFHKAESLLEGIISDVLFRIP